LSEEDERRVYEFCDQQRATTVRGQDWWLFKQFIMWQIDTGMRKSETFRKGLADVRGDVVMLYKWETKNREDREVPLTARLQKAVATFKAMEIDGPFFAGLTSGKVWEMWSKVRAELDLGDFTIHDLRHTRGQRLADSGVPLEVIADLLGHKDVSITAGVYTVRKTETLRKWTHHAEQEGTKLRAVS
jgi:integrase